MSPKAVRLLVTRPLPDAERTADALRERGHDPIMAPLLRYEPVPDLRLGPGPWRAMLLTSAAAVRVATTNFAAPMLRSIPVLAVGDRTASAAREAGFAHVTSASGNAGDLAALAAAITGSSDAPLLYLAGEDRAFDFTAALAPLGVAVETLVIYRMVMAATFQEPVRTALAEGAVDGVTHYSRRTAEAYLRCADADGLRRRALAPAHYCLSPQIAALLRAAGAASVRNAPRPDELSLMEMIGS